MVAGGAERMPPFWQNPAHIVINEVFLLKSRLWNKTSFRLVDVFSTKKSHLFETFYVALLGFAHMLHHNRVGPLQVWSGTSLTTRP